MTDIELTDDCDVEISEKKQRERDADPAYQRYSGRCRACGNWNNYVSADDGYGSCCN